jgi:uncharacterized protein (DUF983 family)
MFRGLFAMHETCAICGHRFLREPGYFQGAMYVSYALATIVFLALVLVASLALARYAGFWGALAVAVVIQMSLVPSLYRYSRVIWAHLNIRTQP